MGRLRIVLTGSSGRIGRAIHDRLAHDHNVAGLDRVPAASTQFVGEVDDAALLRRAFDGADAVVHTAALHAPHVGVATDDEFRRINVQGTHAVISAARVCGVRRIIYTSTTALFGSAIAPEHCTWVDDATPPKPRTIYHETKFEAEELLRHGAEAGAFTVRVIRMSRCFPEPAALMAAYRLHRGIDARDVADAHACALGHVGADYDCFIVSGATPFIPDDVHQLARDAPAVFRRRAPALVSEFERLGWELPSAVDRVYDASRAMRELDWTPRFGFSDVIAPSSVQS